MGDQLSSGYMTLEIRRFCSGSLFCLHGAKDNNSKRRSH